MFARGGDVQYIYTLSVRGASVRSGSGGAGGVVVRCEIDRRVSYLDVWMKRRVARISGLLSFWMLDWNLHSRDWILYLFGPDFEPQCMKEVALVGWLVEGNVGFG